jgi:septum site-determining protein MinC
MKGDPAQDLSSAAGNDPPPRWVAQTSRETAARIADPVSVKNKLVYDPVRSGQQIYAGDGDLVLLSPVNAGAEVIADGNIHCYAPLRGRALAGVKGNTGARIFCQCMEAELVAISGNYQIFEEEWPEKVYRKAVQIYLEDERLHIVPLT